MSSFGRGYNHPKDGVEPCDICNPAKSKKKRKAKPFRVEWRYQNPNQGSNWARWNTYETEEQAQQAKAQLERGSYKCEFRVVPND